MDITHVGEPLKLKGSFDNKFKMEINLGLALPAKFRIPKNYEINQEHKSLVSNVDEHGNIFMLEVKTQSEQGPLGGRDNDVLMVLLSMAHEQKNLNYKNKENQNGYRVYYTLQQIADRLNLSDGSRYNISESIEKIKSQKLKLKNFSFLKNDERAFTKEEETRIIIKHGRVSMADSTIDEKSDSFKTLSYVEFDNYVINNLYNDYVSVLSSKKYLSLGIGPCRRLFTFLTSKRKAENTDRIYFKLSELSQVLGLTDSKLKKQRELIDKYLEQTKLDLKTFQYHITKQRGVNEYDIVVTFYDQELLLDSSIDMDSFYRELVEYYTQEKLKSLDIVEVDIISMRKEFDNYYKNETNKDRFEYFGKLFSPTEFAIDIALIQVFEHSYEVTKTFKALVKGIVRQMANGVVETPDKYRAFVTERNKKIQKEKHLTILAQMKAKEEEKKKRETEDFEKAFDVFFETIISTKPRLLAKYKEKAKELLAKQGITETDLAFDMALQAKTRFVAQADFKAGNAMDIGTKAQ